MKNIIFKDNSFHYTVLSALWKTGKITDNEIESKLSDIDENLEEWEKIEFALNKLKEIKLNSSSLSEIEILEMDINFQLLFEGFIGVETGGEDDYAEIENMEGIEYLNSLTILNLESLNTCSGTKTLDLYSIKNHPKLEKIIFGNGTLKNIYVIDTLPSLKEIKISNSTTSGEKFDQNIIKKLELKNVKVLFHDF